MRSLVIIPDGDPIPLPTIRLVRDLMESLEHVRSEATMLRDEKRFCERRLAHQHMLLCKAGLAQEWEDGPWPSA